MTPTYADQAVELATANGITLPIADQPLAFLKAVWGVLPSDALVGITAEDAYPDKAHPGAYVESVQPGWCWNQDAQRGEIGRLLAWAEGRNRAHYPVPRRGGVFWHVASRKPDILGLSKRKRGDLNELVATGVLACDLDCAKHGYTLEQGIQVLLGMALPPSIVVFTGGGLQAIHLLSEPWPLPHAAAALEYKAHSLALYRPAFQAAGLQLDTSVHEASRMLRLPGFVNRKPERGGAVAQVVYWHPERRYPTGQIKAAAPLPVAPALSPLETPSAPPADGTYLVGLDFITYLVEGEQPAERHPALLRLAMQAVRAGIPEQAFLEAVRPIAQRWFAEAPLRAEAELDKLTAWAYQAGADPDVVDIPEGDRYGTWAVKIEAGRFVKAGEEPTHSYRTAILPTPPAPPPETLSLDAARAGQQTAMQAYLEAPLKDLATYLLVRSAPGVGKTQAIVQLAEQLARKRLAEHPGKPGKVAILGLFALEEAKWPDWVKSFGGDPALYQYFVGRNDDQYSAGYCALYALADGVARKGYPVTQKLCMRCPYRAPCKQQWYLSQIERAYHAPIVLLRHQHGDQDSLVGYRRFLFFDESPLNVVAAPDILKPDDLSLDHIPPVLFDQHPEAMTLLVRFVDALKTIVGGMITGANKLIERIKLGGRWLFDRLAEILGTGQLEALAQIDPALVGAAQEGTLPALTDEAVKALPLYFLPHLWSAFQYEHDHHYRRRAARWNSRLIPWDGALRVYPMQPFEAHRRTRIIVADATGDPALYPQVFADLDGHPRQGQVFEAALDPQSTIIQYTGTDNSKHTTKRQVIKDVEGNVVKEFDSYAVDNATVQRARLLIADLAKKHDGSLLVVTYQELAKKLRRDLTLGVSAEQIAWFGSLRGKNDFKHLNAVLLIGRHRIPDVELVAQCQVWHWRDELPIDTSRQPHEAPYPGYTAPDGKGRAYRYWGYVDQRLDHMWFYNQAAESRQCADRIRYNSSRQADGTFLPKCVYVASALPCTDYVSQLVAWEATDIQAAIRVWLADKRRAAATEFSQAEAVQAIATLTGREPTFVRETFIHEITQGVDPADGTPWTTVFNYIKAGRTRHFGQADGKQPVGVQVMRWLKADPARLALPIREAQTQLESEGIFCCFETVRRARRRMGSR